MNKLLHRPVEPFAHMESRARVGAESTLSFDEVYEQHFRYVYRIVSRLYGRGDVEDLVQDIFVVVHEKLAAFEGRASLTTWLFRIAYRVVGAQIRRERFRRRWLTLFGRPIEVNTNASTPETHAVRLGLEKLSFKKRTVLVLFEVEGWSCAEIAEQLGVPVDTVYTRLHHARKELAQILSPETSDDASAAQRDAGQGTAEVPQ